MNENSEQKKQNPPAKIHWVKLVVTVVAVIALSVLLYWDIAAFRGTVYFTFPCGLGGIFNLIRDYFINQPVFYSFTFCGFIDDSRRRAIQSGNDRAGVQPWGFAWGK